MRTITDEQKIYELSKIWKEAEYNFAFWDKVNIDWDAEYKKTLNAVLGTKDIYDYYRELQRFLVLLNDGHTGVNMPMDVMQDPEFFSMIPVYLWHFGEDIAVINVTEEYKDRIPLYSTLKKVNGIDASEYIRENCYPFIWHAKADACGISAVQELMYGRVGSFLDCTFEKDGKSIDIRLDRENPFEMHWQNIDYSIISDEKKETIYKGESFSIEMTEDDIAILKFLNFDDPSMPEKVYEEYDELKKARGFLIDVRANTGGNSENANAVAALFTKGAFKSCVGEYQIYEPTYKAHSVFREDFKDVEPSEIEEKYSDKDTVRCYRIAHHICYERGEDDDYQRPIPGKLIGPLVVLMNQYTFSAAEDFVDVMKKYTDAVFLGINTAGSSGQPLFVPLESGGSFRICTWRCIAQNGEDIYNKGFSPDIKVVGTPDDFIDRRDKTMEKAMEILREKLSVTG